MTDKKKISQAELRQLMKQNGSLKKIDSPFLKRNSSGQLVCIVCNAVIKSELLWKSHIIGRVHKENLELLKGQKKEEQTTSGKRAASENVSSPLPAKVRKEELPSDFFSSKIQHSTQQTTLNEKDTKRKLSTVTSAKEHDSNVTQRTVKQENVSKRKISTSTTIAAREIEEEQEKEAQKVMKDETLPEGFFDDPKLDAKARNVEYRDPVEEEWEKFQKEIKEATTESTRILEEERAEATVDRQLEEIDEQLRNWSRVMDMEKRKKQLQAIAMVGSESEERTEGSNDEAEFDDFLDWRAKKL